MRNAKILGTGSAKTRTSRSTSIIERNASQYAETAGAPSQKKTPNGKHRVSSEFGACARVDGEWIGKVKRSTPSGADPEAEGIIRGKPVWTFTGEGTTGTFEGVRLTKWIGTPRSIRSYIEAHMVLYGTGDFEGQTLKLSYEGAPPAVFEGYLVIPN